MLICIGGKGGEGVINALVSGYAKGGRTRITVALMYLENMFFLQVSLNLNEWSIFL
jgi:hypothetical protein